MRVTLSQVWVCVSWDLSWTGSSLQGGGLGWWAQVPGGGI